MLCWSVFYGCIVVEWLVSMLLLFVSAAFVCLWWSCGLQEGSTPLMISLEKWAGRTTILEMLLEHRARLDLVKNVRTIRFCLCDSKEMVMVLVRCSVLRMVCRR